MTKSRSGVADTPNLSGDDESGMANDAAAMTDVPLVDPTTDPGAVSLLDDTEAAATVTDQNAVDEGAAAALDRLLSHWETQGDVYEGAIADVMLIRSILRRAIERL